MINFIDFKELENTRRRKLANNTYLVIRDDGGYGIRLHETEVIIHYPSSIILDSGGWQTVTTKARINRFSSAQVWSNKGVWMVTWQGAEFPFADRMELFTNGSVAGEGDDPKAAQKLRKHILQFSNDYADAFVAGEIPAPSSGDCWSCYMITKDGKSAMGSSHILTHLDEKYYVPSMLNRMSDAGTLSLFAKDFISRTWSPDHDMPTEQLGSIVHDQIRKSIRKFCLRELGMVT